MASRITSPPLRPHTRPPQELYACQKLQQSPFRSYSSWSPKLKADKAGRLENVVGWYHSHPGYGCWLSGIDVLTQMLNQQFQEPFLAVVIDPTRTVSADIRRCVLHYERASSTLSSSTFTSVTDVAVKVMLLLLPFIA